MTTVVILVADAGNAHPHRRTARAPPVRVGGPGPTAAGPASAVSVERPPKDGTWKSAGRAGQPPRRGQSGRPGTTPYRAGMSRVRPRVTHPRRVSPGRPVRTAMARPAPDSHPDPLAAYPGRMLRLGIGVASSPWMDGSDSYRSVSERSPENSATFRGRVAQAQRSSSRSPGWSRRCTTSSSTTVSSPSSKRGSRPRTTSGRPQPSGAN